MKLAPNINATLDLPQLDHSLFALPLTPEGDAYYAASNSFVIEDKGFGFFDEQGWCALVPYNAVVSEALTWHGFPIEIWLREGISYSQLRKLARDLIGTLKQRARAAGANNIRLREPQDRTFNEILCALLLQNGSVADSSYAIMVDLALDDASLLAGMRTGHRQQVHQGSRAISIVHADGSSADKGKFDAFRELHAEVAGRVTRPLSSWHRMFDIVKSGQGDLILSYFNGELIGGTLMLDAASVSYYASGAYSRSHFDKPVGHYPLFQSMLRARSRGCTHVHLGEIAPFSLAKSDKERSIDNFKIGFSSSLTPSRIWQVPVSL